MYLWRCSASLEHVVDGSGSKPGPLYVKHAPAKKYIDDVKSGAEADNITSYSSDEDCPVQYMLPLVDSSDDGIGKGDVLPRHGYPSHLAFTLCQIPAGGWETILHQEQAQSLLYRKLVRNWSLTHLPPGQHVSHLGHAGTSRVL